MTKPIEPGCLAVVVGNPTCNCDGCRANVGKKVVVGQCVGVFVPGFENAWRVTTVVAPLRVFHPLTGEEKTAATGVVPEPWLQRLDDPQGEDETLTWTDKPEVVPC